MSSITSYGKEFMECTTIGLVHYNWGCEKSGCGSSMEFL